MSDDHGHGGHGDHGHGHDAVPATVTGGLSKQQLLLMYGFVKDEKKDEYKKRFGYLSEA